MHRPSIARPGLTLCCLLQDRVLGANLLQQAELQELQEAAAEEANSGSDADCSSDAGSLDADAAAGAASSLAGAAVHWGDEADEAEAAALEAEDSVGAGRSQQAGSNSDAAADSDGAANGTDAEAASDAGAEQLGLDESDSDAAAQPSDVNGPPLEGSAAEPRPPAGSQHDAALMEQKAGHAADSATSSDGELAGMPAPGLLLLPCRQVQSFCRPPAAPSLKWALRLCTAPWVSVSRVSCRLALAARLTPHVLPPLSLMQHRGACQNSRQLPLSRQA